MAFARLFMFALLAANILLLPTSAWADPISAGEIQIVDADTIRLRDGKPNVRLVGFNAPELARARARCDAERELGVSASKRLRELIAGSNLHLEFVRCSCPAGTEGTRFCNQGRRCGVLKVDSQDVGAILIKEKLAVPFRCGKTRCPKTPRPWCN